MPKHTYLSPVIPCPIPTNKQFKNLTGLKFGELTILEFEGRRGAHFIWKCQCGCGGIKSMRATHIVAGRIKTCGCGKSKLGYLRDSAEYRTWSHMLSRCSNPNTPDWCNYGGRGIAVCDRWRRFDNFYADMGQKPSTNHALDRINNNGNYTPGNCRWATQQQQQRNKRNNRLITFRGKTMVLSDWADELNIPAPLILGRIKLGWAEGRALTQPVRISRKYHSAAYRVKVVT